MPCLLKRVLPFCLTLLAGVTLGSWRHHETQNPLDGKSPRVVTETPLTIVSVPDLDFPVGEKKGRQQSLALTKTSDFSGSVRLIALFDQDGRVKEVRPYPMLPYGVPESAAGHGPFAAYTPLMKNGWFVKELGAGLVAAAINQARQIRFIPRTVNGEPVGEWAMVTTIFSYNESRFSTGCNSIEVTIMDDGGTRWHGNTWMDRNRGCILI